MSPTPTRSITDTSLARGTRFLEYIRDTCAPCGEGDARAAAERALEALVADGAGPAPGARARAAFRLVASSGSFDGLGRDPRVANDVGLETARGNFLVREALAENAGTSADPRFATGAAASAIAARTGSVATHASTITLAQGGDVTLQLAGLPPHSERVVRVELDAHSKPRMLRFRFRSTSGASDPLHQILRLADDGALVDLTRSDDARWSKTIRADVLGSLLVVVATREEGGDVELRVDEVASASDVMVTRANCAAGTEHEVDPAAFAWSWISPDVMIDNDGDLLSDGLLRSGDNALLVRLRNRGNAPARRVVVRLACQPAALVPDDGAWIPITDSSGAEQTLTIAELAPGAEEWFSTRWLPPGPDPSRSAYCVQVEVTAPRGPTRASRRVVTRVGRIEPNEDPDFGGLAAADGALRATTDVVIASRGNWTIRPTSGASTSGASTSSATAAALAGATRPRASHARYSIAAARDLSPGVRALRPDPERAYAVDPRTLPPGISAADLVTAMRIVDGEVVGGMTWQVVARRDTRT